MVSVKYTLTVNNQDITELCEGEIRITTQRRGAGKLVFTILYDEEIEINEGDTAVHTLDGEIMFKGYVLKQGNKENNFIEIKCHDQIINNKN
ncbi:MAG: hypothetical protein FWC16_06140 [Defluviitaleaceae bacterium]|nr:hypothetical protein [Defluviitaleaceae bacterium]MCL2274489.1 hypothetical protein [Defluviitaleaceae bacterium]